MVVRLGHLSVTTCIAFYMYRVSPCLSPKVLANHGFSFTEKVSSSVLKCSIVVRHQRIEELRSSLHSNGISSRKLTRVVLDLQYKLLILCVACFNSSLAQWSENKGCCEMASCSWDEKMPRAYHSLLRAIVLPTWSRLCRFFCLWIQVAPGSRRSCKHPLVRLLVQVSLDESDEQDGTPLHYAAKKGFVGLAKVLAGAGATIDVRNVKNMTPLHLVSGGLSWADRCAVPLRLVQRIFSPKHCCSRCIVVREGVDLHASLRHAVVSQDGCLRHMQNITLTLCSVRRLSK